MTWCLLAAHEVAHSVTALFALLLVGLIVDYRKEGFLPAQRPVDVPWRNYVWADDLVMIPLDAAVTGIATGSTDVQVARGTPQTDADGTRTATLVFQPGSRYACSAAGEMLVDRIVATGEVGGTGEVWMALGPGGAPQEQAIIESAASSDYAGFSLAGPQATPDPDPPHCVDACLAAFDFEFDNDVDLRDFGGFQAVFDGP